MNKISEDTFKYTFEFSDKYSTGIWEYENMTIKDKYGNKDMYTPVIYVPTQEIDFSQSAFEYKELSLKETLEKIGDKWLEINQEAANESRIKGKTFPKTTLELYEDSYEYKNHYGETVRNWRYMGKIQSDDKGEFDFGQEFDGLMDYKIIADLKKYPEEIKKEKIFQIKDKR